MLSAILETLPIAIATVIATLPVLAIPLILLTRRDMAVLQAFNAGYALGFILVGGVVILMADLLAPNPNGPATWIVWIRILLGLALMGLGWRKWAKHEGAGSESNPPDWMRNLDTVSSRRALTLGVLVVVLNPKNVVLVASGALTIAAATQRPLAQAGALIVFTAVAGIGVATPWLMWIALGERAIPPLDRLKQAMARNNATIMALVLFLIGLVVLAGALTYV